MRILINSHYSTILDIAKLTKTNSLTMDAKMQTRLQEIQNKASNPNKKASEEDEKLPDYVSYGNLSVLENKEAIVLFFHQRTRSSSRKKKNAGCIF
jgi:hypothetical protein